MSDDFTILLSASAMAALQDQRNNPIQTQYVESDLDFLAGFDQGARWGAQWAEQSREPEDDDD